MINQLNNKVKVLIVGLGVIGGGYASALTQQGYRVKCITKEQRDVEYAISHGIIAEGTTQVDADMIRDAELIIFALYPTVFLDWLEKYQHLFSPGTLITDVTGVKSSVVGKAQSILRHDVEFIAAHPMAGRERRGVENSDKEVFMGANYIVTPTEKNTEVAIRVCEELGRTLGFGRITRLTVEEHDKMIGFLSQLTHCIAVTLMTCNKEEGLEKYTGDSFRDLTRIAKINERMWSELFLMNKDALLQQMDSFIEEFSLFRDMLKKEDREGMMEKMRESTMRRSLFDKPKEANNNG